ncbi:ankyrin repeat domain-containing protein SOWAHA [Chiloscyllium punctatum]|uniref:SOWAHA-C winged helix-turn-helix domain-containing protein n=1 Tax=Chiloscyllium punctatum TaxID=137246 RepID=A0A401RV24_CHIPU|nr:hypothetical protein [Chiloscyllium punctatum]
MEPVLSQEVVTNFLVQAGGKVRNSELLHNFRSELAHSDPERKRAARELFKKLINNVAVVREEAGVKFVVLKKKWQPLVTAQQTRCSAPGPGQGHLAQGPGKGESLGDLVEAGRVARGSQGPGARRNSAPSALTPSQLRALSNLSAHLENQREAPTQAPKPDPLMEEWQGLTASWAMHRPKSHSLEHIVDCQHLVSECRPLAQSLSGEAISTSECPSSNADQANTALTPHPPPEPEHLLPLPHSPTEDSTLSFEQKVGRYEAKVNDVNPQGAPNATSAQKPKPYMHPLRLPPDSTRYDHCHSRQQDKEESEDTVPIKNSCQVVSGEQDAPKMNQNQPTEMGSRSPNLKRASRLLKLPEDARFSDQVPLDPIEHEWIVKTALGQWTQVSGLLLRDNNLAEKKDFMYGFTAVHWAAKSGNSEMMCWIIDTAEQNGIKMDVNSKAYGGYTPLHIAAIHDKENIIVDLVQNYGAKTTLRDYSGKRPYHYLNKNNSIKVKRLLGDPETFISESIPLKRGSKVASSILSSTNTLLGALADDISFQEFSKSLKKPPNLGKFFTAPTGHKKRVKMRVNFASLNEEEEEKEIVLKRRPVTEVFY